MKNISHLKLCAFKKLLVIFLISFFSITTHNSFAQGRDAGGSDDGVINETCPTSFSFKRNNGNGWGVCHGDAQIRVVFNPMPSPNNIPVLTGVYYEDDLLTNIILPVSGDMIDKTKPYISYCMTGSFPARNNGNPRANIPPAVKLVLEFTYPSGLVCRTNNEVAD